MTIHLFKKGRFLMKTPAQGFMVAMILCAAILVNAQKVNAQDGGDTIAQASDADTVMIAMAQLPAPQNGYAIQPAAEMRVMPNDIPQEKTAMAKRNYEEVGNALGFMLPILTMVGFVLVTLL
jgi:hypothetical protein